MLGRARVHEVDVLDDDDDVVLQDNTNLNSAYETATLDYIMTNAVHGTADGCWAGEGSSRMLPREVCGAGRVCGANEEAGGRRNAAEAVGRTGRAVSREGAEGAL